MCGISGLFLNEGNADPALVRGMTAAMRRRGPDAEGIFAEGGIGLGHRRLKILDLSDSANQPMWSAGGQVGLVYNGEVYNFKELRKELEKLGRSFATRSDTEVALAAFEEWGTKAFARFDGMFAAAFLDRRGTGPVLYLLRDRFGVKPLFYSFTGGRVAFASELKPLLLVPWVRKQVAPETLFHFLEFSHVPSPLSILEDVRQIQPGSWLRFERGEMTEGRFWAPNRLLAPGAGMAAEPRGDDEWLDEFDGVLTRSVERQLVSDVPVGCFLSGGIDSSLLLMACENLGRKVESFTIGYREKEFDETVYARQIAEAFGSPHEELIAKPKDFFDLIPELPSFFDQPFADPTLLASLLLSRFARKKVTVTLSGDGGDELFFGYSQQAALHWLRGLTRVPAAIRAPGLALLDEGARALGLGALHRRVHQGQKLAQILQFTDEAEFFQYFIGTIGPLRRDRLAKLVVGLPSTPAPPFRRMLAELEGTSSLERISQVFVRTFLVDTVLAKTDRAGMAFGLETRVPFLDDEMAGFSARLPFRHKFSPKPGLTLKLPQGKLLLRRSLERSLEKKGVPAELSRRPKQGFGIPLREWLRGDLRYLLDEYLGRERLKKEGFFSAEEVNRLVAEHCSSRANHSHLLWSLISFQLWRERYLA